MVVLGVDEGDVDAAAVEELGELQRRVDVAGARVRVGSGLTWHLTCGLHLRCPSTTLAMFPSLLGIKNHLQKKQDSPGLPFELIVSRRGVTHLRIKASPSAPTVYIVSRKLWMLKYDLLTILGNSFFSAANLFSPP